MTGRHRNSSGFRRTSAILLTFVAVLAVGGAGWAGYTYLNRPMCTGSPLTLKVAAAPEITAALQSTATAFARTRKTGRCIAVNVVSADPSEVSATLAGAAGTTLTGLGNANGKAQVPDVWVPDSSLWLARLAAATNQQSTTVPPSIASSPVVFATPEPIARQLGWPDKPVTWEMMLGEVTKAGGVKSGIVNPARDAAGLSGLLTLAAVAQATGGANADKVTVAALRTLAQNQSTIRDDLTSKFPKAADAASMASGLGAAPLTEQAVLAYNAAQPPVPLVALYVQPAATPMDYPYVVLPGTAADATKAQLAKDLLAQLSGPAYRNALAQQGLRAADGSFGTGFSAGPGAPTTIIQPTADPATVGAGIDKALNTWQAVTQSGRLLAVVDVSASMMEKVPTAGNKTREEVTVESAGRGLALFDDSWSVGLWVFSTNMVGTKPYKEVVPIGPLSVQRPTIVGGLGLIKPKSHSDTGLYDTTIAAYKTVQQGWDPGRANSVVIFTDGQNDNRTGINLDQLKAQLKDAADPAKPIQLIIIGIGDGVSKAELDQIVVPVGGACFVVADPTKIVDAFLQAIALRQKNN